MWNLYSITTNQDAIPRLFGVAVDSAGNLPSLASLSPEQEAPVVRNQSGGRELVKMRWGMPPPPKNLADRRLPTSVTPHRRIGAAGSSPKTVAMCQPAALSEYAPEAIPTTGKKDVVWFAINDERPLFAFAGLWTKFKGVRGPESKPVPGSHLV
jgi:putative SOS response-associated peptidase YedK